ncbi:MAG: hypothetical protein IV100_31360 [Myxococcales bacterium]|nr:hypothetical protein [Myxococcales bacterium]
MNVAARLVPLTLILALSACESPETVAADDSELGLAAEIDPEYGKPLLGVAPEDEKGDAATGIKGPVQNTSKDHAVWEVRNQWADTTTAEAKAAGMAWPANSGLTWDEKYAAWVASMPKHAVNDWKTTFSLTTPQGKSVQAPQLECAETAVFLRASFASWYGLPFYLTASENGKNLHFGHFGVYTDNGPDPRFSRYKVRYKDHSALSAAAALAAWPTDSALRARKLTPSGDDQNAWLGEGAYAGAYFDEVFLNKRVGHFLFVLLTYTGSIHLSSHWNTFNLAAADIREGDVLVERWQRQGIGHTLVVKRVAPIPGFEQNLDVELMSGSMPRRQPVWSSPASSKSYLTSEYTGGPGDSDEDGPYAALGGGIKRWRTPVVQNGRWRNVIPQSDLGVWVNHTDLAAIAARTAEFEQLLGVPTPEERLAGILDVIEGKRQHLRELPASCSARAGREEAFGKLYELMAEDYGTDRAETDRQYRLLEDYVFAELRYDQSRTCCWNSTNPAMYEVVMDLAKQSIYDAQTSTCNEPPVFRMEDGGYARWAAHAASMGVAAEWAPWSADETCPQAATVTTDTLAESIATPYCTLYPEP